MPVGLSCTAPESGFWSLFFGISGAQLSSTRAGFSCAHAAGDRQGDQQAAKRGAGIPWTWNFITRTLLGISDLGKDFLPVFHQVNAAAEILQNSIFRSRGVNRERIKNNKKMDN